MVSQRFQRTLKCRNIRNIKLKKIKHLRKIKWPYYICIYLSTICKIVLYSVSLYGFHDGVSTYMLLSYVLFTIVHFPSDKQLIILQDFLSILYRFTKYFFLIYLNWKSNFTYTKFSHFAWMSPYLDLIKTTHFCISRQQHRNLIGIFSHWAETNICAFHTQYQCPNWPE